MKIDPAQPELALTRVTNGWVIRYNGGYYRQADVIPMAVAETPEALVELIKTWALAQLLEDDKARRGE